MQKYKHLFFDLDRTLWDFNTNSRFALNEIYHTFNLKSEGVIDVDLFIDQYQLINERLWGWYKMGNLKKDELRRKRFTEALAYFGCNNKNLAFKLDVSYLNISPYQNALMPNAIDTLEYLSQNYQMHIITNGFDEVQKIKLTHSRLGQYFKNIITSEKAKARKPNSIIFKIACELAKSKPSEAIMIGDDLKTDIIGARSVGMDQVYFNPEGNSHNYTDISFEITGLQQLKSIL